MNETASIPSELLKARNIFINCAITPEFASAITQTLLYLNGENKNEPIHIYVSSPGGSVYDGLAIIDVINAIKAPVHTYALGLAASMGALIFLAGQKRVMMPNAYLMLHQPLGGAQGQTSDIELISKQFSTIKHRINLLISNRSKLKLKEVASLTDRDCYIDAGRAFELGLCDEIYK